MVMSIGAFCFGFVIGYVTYRTLIRTDTTSISDIAAVVAAVGGAAVTQLFDPAEGDLFGWYAIGLLAGMAVFLVLRLVLERPGGRDVAVLGNTEPGSARSDIIGE